MRWSRTCLSAAPLPEALRRLPASGGGDSWKQQIELIDQQLAGDLPSEVRAPLAAAQRQLQKAASRAAQPWQAKIAGAVASILEAEGVAWRPARVVPPARAKGNSRRPRVTAEAMQARIIEALPVDHASGLAGKNLARECGVSYPTLRRSLVALQDQGQVVRHGEGPDTTWHRKVH